jgi:hypothetical protein
VGGGGGDCRLGDQLGAVWLVTGGVGGSGDGFVLLVELHDVVYGDLRQEARFPLPRPEEEGFRMAVHRASDEIVRWVTGEPGMAASRIAFSVAGENNDQDLYLIDSDGENPADGDPVPVPDESDLARVFQDIVASPDASVYRYRGNDPLMMLGLFDMPDDSDDHVMVCGEHDDGASPGVIQSTRQPVREWAESYFEARLVDSEPLQARVFTP